MELPRNWCEVNPISLTQRDKIYVNPISLTQRDKIYVNPISLTQRDKIYVNAIFFLADVHIDQHSWCNYPYEGKRQPLFVSRFFYQCFTLFACLFNIYITIWLGEIKQTKFTKTFLSFIYVWLVVIWQLGANQIA
jgi:hypothetical protein